MSHRSSLAHHLCEGLRRLDEEEKVNKFTFFSHPIRREYVAVQSEDRQWQKANTKHTHWYTLSFRSTKSEGVYLYLNAAPVNEAIYFPHSVSISAFMSQLFIISATVTAHVPIWPSNQFLKGATVKFLLPHGTVQLQHNGGDTEEEQGLVLSGFGVILPGIYEWIPICLAQKTDFSPNL